MIPLQSAVKPAITYSRPPRSPPRGTRPPANVAASRGTARDVTVRLNAMTWCVIALRHEHAGGGSILLQQIANVKEQRGALQQHAKILQENGSRAKPALANQKMAFTQSRLECSGLDRVTNERSSLLHGMAPPSLRSHTGTSLTGSQGPVKNL